VRRFKERYERQTEHQTTREEGKREKANSSHHSHHRQRDRRWHVHNEVNVVRLHSDEERVPEMVGFLMAMAAGRKG
jgi:hypothetical protein